MFELLAEYHLPQELIVQNQENFMNLFSESMKDTNPRVRVATLKALTTFITSIDDEEQVLKYSMMMNNLLDIVIENLKLDEAQGRSSLESLIDLTSSYSEIWGQSKAKLIHVCSEIMKNKEFEDATRDTALEIISTLAEENPKMLKSLSDKL
jgi:DNA primase